MFRNLLSRLFSDAAEPKPLAPQDAEIAIAALLVRVARADDHYNAAEQGRIDEILARMHGIDLAEAAERRSVAEMIEAEAPDTVRFTRLVKDRVSPEDRAAIIHAMWQVALVDNHRHTHEESAIRLVSSLLGVPDRESAIQRQRIAAAR